MKPSLCFGICALLFQSDHFCYQLERPKKEIGSLHLGDRGAGANNAEPLLAPTRVGIGTVLSPSCKLRVLTEVIVHSTQALDCTPSTQEPQMSATENQTPSSGIDTHMSHLLLYQGQYIRQ
jgi:hypothetical protein